MGIINNLRQDKIVLATKNLCLINEYEKYILIIKNNHVKLETCHISQIFKVKSNDKKIFKISVLGL